jgi:hypothetical protein
MSNNEGISGVAWARARLARNTDCSKSAAPVQQLPSVARRNPRREVMVVDHKTILGARGVA